MQRFGLVILVGFAACSAPPVQVEVVEEAVTVCAGASKVLGVDVSYYQGTIDWNKVKASGRQFGITRTNDGSFQDPKFAANWAGMKSAGMIRGAYQFFRAGNDPIADANILLAKIGKLADGDLPPVLDVEVTDGQSAATIVSRMTTWLKHVEAATGRVPIIYTAPGFWSQIGNPNMAHYTLWVANWQVSCPSMPGGWSGWKLWQFADNGSVPGISGSVDVDEFNGTLAQLQALAGNPNTPPKGYLDAADCTHLTGWAQDPDAPAQSIDVHLYLDGAAGDAKATMFAVAADVSRADLCGPLGSCKHGFEVATPRGILDGQPHTVRAYGIDSDGGANTLLTHSPKTITCAPPTPPIAASEGVKRWISSGTVLADWKLSRLFDLAHLPDAEVAAYANGPDLPAKPVVVQADDGTPSVWVLDGKMRRHVINGASMAAWGFKAVKTAAAQVYDHAEGPPFPDAPFLIQGSDPRVYVLDVSSVQVTDIPADGTAAGGTPADGTAGGGDPAGTTPTSDGVGMSCTISGRATATRGTALLLLFGVLLVSVARRSSASARRRAHSAPAGS